MTFNEMKSRYIAVIQLVLQSNIPYNEVKTGNEVLHKFCELIIDSWDSANNKIAMKQELLLLKETIATEIDEFYNINRF